MFLEINGKRVEVDDSFKNLPADQQQAAVDHIASTMGQKPEAAATPANSPAGTHPYKDPIGAAALGAAVGATPNLIGKGAGIVGDVAKAAINSVKGTPPSVAPPPPSSLDAKLNTNIDKGTWEPPKFTPKGMPVDLNVPSDVYNWHIGQHADVPVRGTNQKEAERLAQEWVDKQAAKAAFEKANPGKTLTETGLVVSIEDAAKMAQKEEAKKAAELLEWRIKQQAAEKMAEKTATTGERLGAAANIGKKLPVAGALSMANITDLENRLTNEQYPQAVISGAGTVGSLLPFVKGVSDKVKLGGTAGAVAAPLVNMAIDGKAPSKEDVAMGALGMIGGPFVQGMMPGTVQAATLTKPDEAYEEGQTGILKGTKLPGYADGGDVKKPVAGIAGVYNQVGPVQGPNLSSIWAEHLASLPEKTAQNIMNTNTMVQNAMPYSFDPKKPLFDPNPNYDTQAAKDFNDYAANFMGSIKSPGGQWLGDRVKYVANKLKFNDVLAPMSNRPTIEQIAQMEPRMQETWNNINRDELHNTALNKWIDSNLNKYIKNQFGTESDPVRELAEKGITHLPGVDQNYVGGMEPWTTYGKSLAEKRKSAGMPPNPISQTELGKQWENKADLAINPNTAQDLLTKGRALRYPWLRQIEDRSTPIHDLSVENLNSLGFNHIIDILKQDLRSGELRPDQLNKVSVPDAVVRAHLFNEQQAKAMAKAQFQAETEMPVHKEYPEGYKWLELKHPEDPKVTEQALKYEGDAMGHCVGGYCPDVEAGKTKIYSLRDAKGEPHVTIEVQNKAEPWLAQTNTTIEKGGRHKLNWETRVPISDEIRAAVESEASKQMGSNSTLNNAYDIYESVLRKYLGEPEPVLSIKQIKGKQNAAPKDEYKPFVQDFVKSGNWEDVREAHNAGLIPTSDLGFLADIYPKNEALHDLNKISRLSVLNRAVREGEKLPKYITREEYEDILQKYVRNDPWIPGSRK